VGQGRFELPTSRLSGVRSNQLSYWPERTRRRAPHWAVACAGPSLVDRFRLGPSKLSPMTRSDSASP
jgi:hypothetical protein